MKELKVGMYVRTKDGKIFDCYVSEQMGKPIYYPKSSKTNGYIDYEEVYKKSKCIIDLIKLGDYVNGKEVAEILTDEHGNVTDIAYLEEVEGQAYSLQPIKNIATKEQFESMKYVVEE